MRKRETYFPATVVATTKVGIGVFCILMRPLTSGGNDITNDKTDVADGEMEETLSRTVRVPRVGQSEYSSECPRREGKK
jgi:hypothetical protein